MKIKRGIFAAALIAGALALGSAPAHAIPPPPPGGDNLMVISYYDGQRLVGQRWLGCNRPPGQWGTLAGSQKTSFVPC
jgi:Spy/CpxP family protein refolding chaperone